jgi:adenylate kinase family enzyme
MRRILIVGSGGSGKSTLARQLGELLRIEVIHLDALHWKPGWVATPESEWRCLLERLVQQDTWIIDGTYGATLELRLAAADTILFLDLPRTLCLWRVLLRGALYAGRHRPDMAPGCPERIQPQFLRWVWRYPTASRPRLLEKLQRYSRGRRIIHLRSSAEVRQFLERISGEVGEGSLAQRDARGEPEL